MYKVQLRAARHSIKAYDRKGMLGGYDMKKSQHTPGPWTYNDRSANRVTGPGGDVIAATYGGIVGTHEQVSNTRLIAFAPAMYSYIEKRASEGDEQARIIVADVEGPGQ
jgi:hypothetical protein